MEELISISQEYRNLQEVTAAMKAEEFVLVANKMIHSNKISERDLVIKISAEIVKNNTATIDIFLLIKLMWDGDEKVKYCLKSLSQVLELLLKSSKIGAKEEYYIESLIDIWNYNSDELIPIKILEKIILKDHKGNYSYGGFIKAISYLNDHDSTEVDKIIAKIKTTKRYKEDEYYREWI